MYFSNADLKRLIVPLMIDQLLQTLVGIADSVMAASVGEAAVSGVSLVDTMMTLMILTSTALATGGSVAAGQYLGQNNPKMACQMSNELVVFSGKAFFMVMIFGYLGKDWIINGLFGEIETEVANNCQMYFMIVLLSIPMIAVYNAAAALVRTMGDATIIMKLSLLMNGINVAGNAFLIYGFHIGVAGVAIPSVVSRMVACIAILLVLNQQKRVLHLLHPISLHNHPKLLKKILYIGIPNAMENGMFQMGKLLVLRIVSSFGTASIAANAVSNTLERFVVLPGNAIGMGLLTVTAYCVGKRDFVQTRYYTRKLLKMTYFWMAVFNLLLLLLLPVVIEIYGLSQEASRYVRQIMVYHTFCTIAIWPLTFSFPYMLRAAGDVHFTMFWSMISMWIFRIGFSWILGKWLNWGVFGIWVAMTIDWIFRSICFTIRYLGRRWEHRPIV